MRESTLWLVVFWGVSIWALLGLIDLFYRIYRLDARYPVPRVEPDDDELMECPYCGEIEFPYAGGECNACHMEAYF